MRTLSVILLAFGGYAGDWWLETYEPVAVIQEQLTAIDNGEYLKAYEYLSSTAKATLSLDQFVATVQNNSVVMEIREASLPMRVREGQTATISGVLTGYGEWICESRYVLVLEEGRWRIHKFYWSPPRRSKPGDVHVSRQHARMPISEMDSQCGTSTSAVEIFSAPLPVTGICSL